MATAKASEDTPGGQIPAFVLRPVLENIRLAESDEDDVHIKCIEYWGTS